MQRAPVWLWGSAFALLLPTSTTGFLYAWVVSSVAPARRSPTGVEVPTACESTFTVTTLPLYVTVGFWLLLTSSYIAPLLAGIIWSRDPSGRRRNVLLALFLGLLALAVVDRDATLWSPPGI